MAIEIKAPVFPESVADGTVATWHKQPGEAVSRDELLVDIETDKVVLEVVAPANGKLSEILVPEGETVEAEQLLANFEEGEFEVPSQPAGEPSSAQQAHSEAEVISGPAVRKLLDENDLDASQVPASGKDGRLTKEDVLNYLKSDQSKAAQPASAEVPRPSPSASAAELPILGERVERRVPMTRLRKRIAERLLDAKQGTAMLTTFNEVNMEPLMRLRKKYQDTFQSKHDGTKLGFMSMFVRACCEALKQYPAVNASIDGDDIVYHGYQDIGVAVSTERGLVVPVLRDADQLSLAKIENLIKEYGGKARDGKLGLEEMQGGTFTVTNGGVFGSLLSTPILNPPQTAILGMHKIQERPMAVNGEVKILPMMYLALSYDHRLIDGKDAVQFLVTVKDMIEDPARILLEI